ncbi:MAG TPA: hypothetical protein VM840_10105 [Actinomycetota bacterium]|nr:hypothetical protein [Actinomycetota bacterium]
MEPRPPADESLSQALLACELAGMHLLNALRSVGIDPAEIRTQAEALDHVWPAAWAYDAWSAWHACRVALRTAGWDTLPIEVDRRTGWRTRAEHIAVEPPTDQP